jgi:very-short-patch-repair endonuclease
VYAAARLVAATEADPQRAHVLQAAAAMLTVADRPAVASHETAARIHGLDLLNAPPEDLVTLTRPPGRFAGRRRQTRFRTAEVVPGHRAKCSGVPVTTPARTVVDLARTTPFMDGVVVADSALRLRKVTKAEMDAVLDRCGGWPGLDKARRVVAFGDERSESVLESCARVVFDRRGLDPPELQVPIDTSGGVYRVDFYWRKYWTIAEADGLLKYADPQRAISQLKRDQLLRDTGRHVVHFTWRQLFSTEDRVVAWLAAAFTGPPPRPTSRW